MINVKQTLSTAVLLITLLIAARVSVANDMAVNYTILESKVEGTMVRGRMAVQVLNLASVVARNVILRLAVAGPNSIETGLYQLGQIPSGEARVVNGEFFMDQEFYGSGQRIVWQVDYDDAGWNHKKQVVLGNEIEQ